MIRASLPVQFDARVAQDATHRFIMNGQAFGFHPVLPVTDAVPVYLTETAA